MKCDYCEEQEATVALITGGPYKEYVCETCAFEAEKHGEIFREEISPEVE